MGGGKYIGQWGNLGCEVKGIITYAIAPNRQRSFAGSWNGIVYTCTRRIWGFGYMFVGLLPWYFGYQYMADAAIRETRKNPNEKYDRSRGY